MYVNKGQSVRIDMFKLRDSDQGKQPILATCWHHSFVTIGPNLTNNYYIIPI